MVEVISLNFGGINMVRQEESKVLTILIIAIILTSILGSIQVSIPIIKNESQIGNIGMPSSAVETLKELLKP